MNPGDRQVPGKPKPGEFELIRRFFAPLARAQPGALGLIDDAALLEPTAGCELVITTDCVVAGVHFPEDEAAGLIARRLLRVNLSDLAAMGARPVGYLLDAAFPDSIDEDWLAVFASGLAADQKSYGISLLGGDTVATPGPLTLSVTALGEVRSGGALRRDAAKSGDRVFVSGTIGDGVLGLRVVKGGLAGLSAPHRDFLADRFHLPQPRVALGMALVGDERPVPAHAALDVSDGLVADLGHICNASGVAAVIEAVAVPLSDAARAALSDDPALLTTILTGGDDYELVFTAPSEAAATLAELSRSLDLPITEIGRIEGGAGVRVIDADGRDLALPDGGYHHF
jgi:thiamine-monophosphate kinase